MITSNNIFKYSYCNLVNENNKIKPNYDLNNKDIYLDIYISPEKKVCIIGRVDNNYICWGSITNLNDEEMNSEIFNYIVSNKFNIYSNEYRILDKEKYYEIRNWYRFYIKKSNVKGMLWQTPFGHFYGDNNENNGLYFAKDILDFYDELINLCNFRISNEDYVRILKNYLALLTEDKEYLYYLKMKPLISILKCEQYLKLSKNEVVRNLYLECMKQSDVLYNQYMNVAR